MTSPLPIRLVLMIILSGFISTAMATLPYQFGPDSQTAFSRCVTFDANGDGCQWQYSSIGSCLLYEGCDNDADDYLFLPPVSVTDTGTYRITAEVMRGAHREVLQIGFARYVSPAALQVAAVIDSEISISYYSTSGGDWHCVQTGVYYPVLRIVSPAGGISLNVRNVQIHKVAGTMRKLPVSLTPTAAEATEFSIMDADHDELSWRFDNDSLCFTATGSTAAKADDWLLTPPFLAEGHKFAFSFSTSTHSSVEESFEVRFGPDTVKPSEWPVVMRFDHAQPAWRRWRVLASTSHDSIPHRFAIRLLTSGGDGMKVRNFHIETTTDSVMQLPAYIHVDSTYNGQGDKWIIMPAFEAPAYENVNVVWTLRGNGPRSPQIELWHGQIDDPQFMSRVSIHGGLSNRESRTFSQRFYCHDPHGSHFIAFHILGSPGWSGGVIESLSIDTLRQPASEELLPFTATLDTVVSKPIVIGPFWVDNPESMLSVTMKLSGSAAIHIGTSAELSRMKLAGVATGDSISGNLTTLLVPPADYGCHYLCLTADTASATVIDSICIERYNIGVTVPGQFKEITATPRPGHHHVADLKILMPSTLINGMTMWEDEMLVVTTDYEGGSMVNYSYPGDTLCITIPAVEGVNNVSVNAANWAGNGLSRSVSFHLQGHDSPREIKNFRALPDIDNCGALLKWQMDTIGVNGGYVSPDSLTFRIEMLQDSLWQSIAEVAAIDSFAFRLPAIPALRQKAQLWKVTASNSLGETDPVYATTLLGTPLSLPLAEDYRGASGASLPWSIMHESCHAVEWSIADTTSDPHSPLNGSLIFTPTDTGASASLLLPAFISGAGVPPLLRLRINTDNVLPSINASLLSNHNIENLPTLHTVSLPGGWNDVYISLADPLPADQSATIRLDILWDNEYPAPLQINEYEIMLPVETGMTLKWASVPDTLRLGEDNMLWAIITNIGSKSIELNDCLLEISDGLKLTPLTLPKGTTLQPYEYATASFNFYPSADNFDKDLVLKLTATVDTALYATASLTRHLDYGKCPIVTNLKGRFVGSPFRLHLQWDAPRYDGFDLQACSPADLTYSIYRDSVMIISGLRNCEYIDTLLTGGPHIYHVAVSDEYTQYPLGNSFMVMVPKSMTTGSDLLLTPHGEILPVSGGILIKGLADEYADIYSYDGHKVARVLITDDNFRLRLQKGLYIVRIRHSAIRLQVRE